MNKNSTGEPVGLISNIQKYTIHDGPGIRTELFFTGCSLKCVWCSNPETIAPQRNFGVYPAKCLSSDMCCACERACPEPARHFIFNDANEINRIIRTPDCDLCMRCADHCPSHAIKTWGQYYTVSELIGIILQDRSFYQRSGGGVTLSGGEVMMQWEFASLLLEECKRNSIHTCVETALHCQWDCAATVFRSTDMIITDVKHMDSHKHREFTGAGNELILENIVNAAQLNIPLIIRTPVVPGYNADDDNLRKTAAFIAGLPDSVIIWQLLPYRKMGIEKYEALGLPYPMGDYEPPERSVWEANLTRLQALLSAEYNISVVAGASDKITVPARFRK